MQYLKKNTLFFYHGFMIRMKFAPPMVLTEIVNGNERMRSAVSYHISQDGPRMTVENLITKQHHHL